MHSKNIFIQANNSTDIKSTVLKLLPNGRREDNEWVTLNPTRNDKNLGSFRVNLINGKWIDYATADKGGDITSLVAYLKGISQHEAAQYLLGNSICSKNWNLTINPPKVPKAPKFNAAEHIRKLWNETLDTKDSIVESYLNHRELLLQNIPRYIRYHPNLYHKPTGKSFPAMLSGVIKYGSDEIVALHRTYLKADGSDKADISPNKMMLGQVKGGVISLATPGSTLILVEGIETALSVYAATKIPALACLSAGGLINIAVPPLSITQEIIIAADADATGIASANKLAIRLLDEGYKVSIAMPSQDTDFNDLLKETK